MNTEFRTKCYEILKQDIFQYNHIFSSDDLGETKRVFEEIYDNGTYELISWGEMDIDCEIIDEKVVK